MTDRELLEVMYQEMCGMKEGMQGMKADMQGMKAKLEEVNTRVTGVESKLEEVNTRVTGVELKLENVTNHNIQLLAENHIDLINKLNKAIHVQDKSLMFEVQISGLKSRMDRLEIEWQEAKVQMA